MIAICRFEFLCLALAIAALGPARADELPPTRYLWNASGQTGSFIYDINAPFNPVFELTWDQANTTHSGEAIQYNVSRDITGTQIFFTGGQVGQGFFSIQMQHPDPNLPAIPNTFDFDPLNDIGPGWIGGQLVTSSGSSPIDSILNDGFASLPPNDTPVLSAARLNGVDGDLVFDEGAGPYGVTLDALATDVQAGLLYFTIDGVGPTAASNTGANSQRTSHSVSRSVPGDDSNGAPAASYEFNVIDPRGAEATITRHVYVQNVAPTITSYTLNGSASDLTVTEGDPFDVITAMSATDPGPDAIDFLINSQVIGTGGATPGSTRQTDNFILPFSGQDGVFPILFSARDDDTQSDTVRTITVENAAPTVTGLSLSATTINEGETLTASMTATDPGPDALALTIHGVDAGQGGATPGSIRTSDTLTLGPFPQRTGASDEIDLVASASDDGDTPGVLTETITVLNLPPEIQSITPDGVVAPGETFAFTALATDPGSDSLRYRWDTDDDGDYDDLSGIGSSPFAPPLEITPDAVGVYPVHLLVDDSDGGEATATITVISVQLTGDYNNNGVVDAADYTVWSDQVGQPFGALLNDPSGLPIGAVQYNAWAANYGMTIPQTLSAPEPSGSMLLTISVLLASSRQSSRRRRLGSTPLSA
ncbi:hypothetical protein MalM25_03950 [Planctomycetes bacterium MalM25]|nr:hypothetical protein MalM25_03950 [Planctomycetes bacterium MalM25]